MLAVLLVEHGRLYARLVAAHLVLHRENRALAETVRERTRTLAAIVETPTTQSSARTWPGTSRRGMRGPNGSSATRQKRRSGGPCVLSFRPTATTRKRRSSERVRRGEQTAHFETVRLTRDRGPLHVAPTISPIRDLDGTIVGASKIARDITARKQTEEALRQSEATALALIDSAAEGILVVDEQGRIVVASRQVEKMFGYAAGELLTRPVEMLLPERLRERHLHHRAGYLADPRVRAMGSGLDLAGRRRDGSEFPSRSA